MDQEQLLLKQLYFHGKEWSFTQIKKHILSFSPSDTDFLYDILKKSEEDVLIEAAIRN